jgi:hypothetical protein
LRRSHSAFLAGGYRCTRRRPGSEASTTGFRTREQHALPQLDAFARPLRQIIAKALAPEEQASSAPSRWVSIAGGTPHLAERALRHRHHGATEPLSICVFSAAARAPPVTALTERNRNSAPFRTMRATVDCRNLQRCVGCLGYRCESSARSRRPTPMSQTRTHGSTMEQRRADPKMDAPLAGNPLRKHGIRATAETGRGAPRAASSNRCGRSSVPAMSAGYTLPPSRPREVLSAAQSPLML